MLRVGLRILIFCLSTLPLRAEEISDPTFNGTVTSATCFIRNVTVCKSSSCEQPVSACQGDLCGTLHLLLGTKQYFFAVGLMPLQITGISAAELGKPLWVKYQIQIKGHVGEGRLTLRPVQAGGYTTSSVVYLKSDDDPTGSSFTLLGMDCERDSH